MNPAPSLAAQSHLAFRTHSFTSVRIYPASSSTNLCVRKSLSQETARYSITSGCRVDLCFDDFCFPFMYEVQISKIFSCKLCCVAFRDEGFLTCVFRGKIGLLLSRLSPCSTPADTREEASCATFSTFFFPLQGSVADGAVDVSHYTRNTVMTAAISL